MSTRKFTKALVVSLVVGFLVAGCSGVSADQVVSTPDIGSENEVVDAPGEVVEAPGESVAASTPESGATVGPAVDSALSATAGWIERRLELSVLGADLVMTVRLWWDADHSERAHLFDATGPGVLGEELEIVRSTMEAKVAGRNGPIDRDALLSERALTAKLLKHLFATTDAVSEIVDGRLVAASLGATAGSGSAGEYWRLGVGSPPW